MDYVDPYHKRIEFSAVSFCSESEGTGQRMIFSSHDLRSSVTLTERGSQIAAKVSEEEGIFILWKVQIMERLHWLTLDFEENPILRRIVVHIEHLDVNELDAALRQMFGARTLQYIRHPSRESGGDGG